MYHRRDYKPFYDDRGDYNTNAPSYYDYLAKKNIDIQTLVDTVNVLLKRHLNFKESSSIAPIVLGSLDKDNYQDIINVVKLSTKSGNSLMINDDGLYSNGEVNNVSPSSYLNGLINGDYTITNNNVFNIPFLSNISNVNSSGMQGVLLDTKNLEWYVTATDKKEPEGFIVLRNDYNGNQISNMYVKNGGHGQNVWLYNSDGKNYIYFANNGNIYRLPYGDFKTYDESDFELILDSGVDTEHSIHGFDFYKNENTSIMAWRTEVNGEYVISAQQANINASGSFDFYGDKASLNIQDIVINNKDNSIQGIAVLNKSDVTGNNVDEFNYYIFVSYGWWSTKSEILVLEYDIKNGTIKNKTTLTNLDKLIRRDNEKQVFELEGLSHVTFNNGNSTTSGLIFTNSGGRSGSYTNRIYGFIDRYNLEYLNSYSAIYKDEPSRLFSNTTTQQHIWEYGSGSYTVRAAEWSSFLDKPLRWSGDIKLPVSYAYVDTIGKRDNPGDLIQRLTIPAYDAPVEIYERYVNFSFVTGSFGADYKPIDITPWAPIGNNATLGKRPRDNDKFIYNLTEQVNYYLPENTANIDYEGLPKEYAYAITNISMGGLRYPEEITYKQVAETHFIGIGNYFYRYTRLVRGKPYEYCSGLETKSKTTDWIKEVIGDETGTQGV